MVFIKAINRHTPVKRNTQKVTSYKTIKNSLYNTRYIKLHSIFMKHIKLRILVPFDAVIILFFYFIVACVVCFSVHVSF